MGPGGDSLFEGQRRLSESEALEESGAHQTEGKPVWPCWFNLKERSRLKLSVRKTLMEGRESSWEEADEPCSTQVIDNVLSSLYVS